MSLLGGAAALVASTGGGSPGIRSVGAAPLGDAVLDAYSIVYETRYGDGDVVTERLDVQRPFRSSFTSASNVRATERGVLGTTSDGDRWLRIEVPIAVAGGDLRPLPVLDRAVADGLVEALGARSVGGRRCRAFRLGGPVSSGTLTPVGLVAGESAEVCIDDLGLVLEERWSADGELVRERRATELRLGEHATAPARVAEHATDLPFEQGGGAVDRVPADHDPGFVELWATTDVPDGFTHAGRFAVVPPALDQPFTAPAPRRADLALITDVWTRGPDLLVIDQGAGRGGVGPPWDEEAPAEPVRLGALGEATLVLDLRMSEVRVRRPDDGFVRVAGTLPPDELLSIARSLVPARPGGQP